MTNRREFLQTTAAITGSFILPTSLFAQPSSNFHFLHVDSYKDWPVADPVLWSLENANEPILERAADGLKKLAMNLDAEAWPSDELIWGRRNAVDLVQRLHQQQRAIASHLR